MSILNDWGAIRDRADEIKKAEDPLKPAPGADTDIPASIKVDADGLLDGFFLGQSPASSITVENASGSWTLGKFLADRGYQLVDHPQLGLVALAIGTKLTSDRVTEEFSDGTADIDDDGFCASEDYDWI